MMKTLKASEHQQIRTQKWHDDCDKWHRDRGLQSFPQLAMYGFHRNYGYVTFDETRVCWRRTKKESIEAFRKWNGEL